MALINCPECGGRVSDKAKACPHCGYAVAVPRCPECGGVVSEDMSTCPGCGYPLQKHETAVVPAVPAADHITVRTQFDLWRTYGFYSFVNAETGAVLVRRLMGTTTEIPCRKPFMLRARATGTVNKSTTCYVVPGGHYVLRWTDGVFGSLVLEKDE